MFENFSPSVRYWECKDKRNLLFFPNVFTINIYNNYTQHLIPFASKDLLQKNIFRIYYIC